MGVNSTIFFCGKSFGMVESDCFPIMEQSINRSITIKLMDLRCSFDLQISHHAQGGLPWRATEWKTSTQQMIGYYMAMTNPIENGDVHGKIFYKWRIVHCYVSLLKVEGVSLAVTVELVPS